MGKSWRIVLNLSAALVAAAATLTPLDGARAGPGCSPGDLLNAFEGAVGSIASASCAAACSDVAGCAVAGTASAILAGVSADAGQSDVDQFCSALQNLGGANASAVLGALNQIPGLSAAASAVADPLDVALCGCSIEQGFGQLTSDVGDCFQDVLCFFSGLLGDPCTCTPQPPVVLNCAQTNSQCGTYDLNNTLPAAVVAACEGQNTVVATGANYCGQAAGNCITGPSGTLVSVPSNGQNAQGQCAPVSFCFCPSPMVPTWTPDSLANLSSSTSGLYIFSCNCPAGQHPQGALGGISVCLCDGTNATPLPPDAITLQSGGGAFVGACPPAGCADGQISLGGKCVTPCSDPSEGMTMDGACCNPSQMTSCGLCCPPGTTPDPTSGSCLPPPPQPK